MSYRYRMYPITAEDAVMVELCGQSRLIWNIALEQMFTAFNMGLKHDWNLWDKQLTELRNTPEFEWLKAGSASAQQQTLRQLRKAWTDRAKNPAHFGVPKFRSKTRTRDGFVVREAKVRKLNRKWSAVLIPKAGWVKFRRDRTLGAHGMAHVTRDRQRRWHVSFSAAQTPVARKDRSEGKAVGVDRGVATTVATSDGELLNIPLPDREEVRKHKRLQRKQARQQPGSRRRQRTKDSIAKIHGRCADRRKDWVEKVSTRLVAENDVVVYEDLKVKNMMRSAAGTVDAPGVNVAQKRGLNALIGQSCWGMLERRTAEKAAASGVTFVKVPAAYTSQRCSRCQYVCAGNRRGKDFCCGGCGHTDDADINASLNVLAAGLVVLGRGELECGVSAPDEGSVKRQLDSVLPLAA